MAAQASQGLGSKAAFGELDSASDVLNRIYQSITAVLASPLLLQYDTAWQEKASAWVLLGLTVAMSATMPVIPVVAATAVAAGTLRTAGELVLACLVGLRRVLPVVHNQVLNQVLGLKTVAPQPCSSRTRSLHI